MADYSGFFKFYFRCLNAIQFIRYYDVLACQRLCDSISINKQIYFTKKNINITCYSKQIYIK